MKALLQLLDWWRCGGFLAALILLWLVTGLLKERQLLHEAASRKINHIAVFVGGTLFFAWLPEANARADLYVICTAVLLLVLLVCWYREVIPFSYIYAANTRQSDAPHATFFFLFSWVVSIGALLLLDLLFAQIAVTRTAVLIVGVADGIAEPIGRRWGRHPYRVLSLRPTPAFRSLEGSMAVWGATIVVVLSCLPPALGVGHWLAAALLTASLATVVEAISPRGFDNFLLLLAMAGLIQALHRVQWVG